MKTNNRSLPVSVTSQLSITSMFGGNRSERSFVSPAEVGGQRSRRPCGGERLSSWFSFSLAPQTNQTVRDISHTERSELCQPAACRRKLCLWNRFYYIWVHLQSIQSVISCFYPSCCSNSWFLHDAVRCWTGSVNRHMTSVFVWVTFTDLQFGGFLPIRD